MFGITGYEWFLIMAILMNITPGTDTMYIMSRSISQGKKAGIYSVLGISTGTLVHTLFAAFGLSVILSQSVMLFTLIKIMGAAYLVYLGFKMFFQKTTPALQSGELQNIKRRKIYLQGIITNITNPKVALFYLSFLPQFIIVDQTYGPIPFLILGVSFTITGTLWCLLIAHFSALATHKLRDNPNIANLLNKLTGIIFIGLGIKLLQTKSPS